MTTDSLSDEFGDLDRQLLDGYQAGFPVDTAPFATVADRLGTTAATVVDRVQVYEQRGLVRRLGPVLDPGVLGASTLAALRVPADDIESVAELVSGYPQVTHNYRRDHAYSLWFVLTARSADQRAAVLEAIADRTGYEPLSLPKLTEYCTDMQFPVVGGRSTEPQGTVSVAPLEAKSTVALDSFDTRLIEAIQDGFPIVERPYEQVADEIDADPDAVRSRIDALLASGAIKRLGLVVDRRAVGYTANSMVAWAVPPDSVDDAGTAAGAHPTVTKCYRRPRNLDRDWPYTLFTMIHAKDAKTVDAVVAELAAGPVPYDYERLETVKRYKQTGTRYETLLPDDG